MKLLFVLIFLVSCNQQPSSSSESSKAKSADVAPETAFVEQVTEPVELINDLYKSACLLENGKKVIYYLDITPTEISLMKKEGVNSNCEGMKNSVVAKFDRESIEFVSTAYKFFTDGGGAPICGQSMNSGTTYSIDGIGCAESYESKPFEISQIEGGYIVNGIEFSIL